MRVVIGAGHGGRDRSNRGPTGYVEADGTLTMARAAGAALEAQGVEVLLERYSDVDLAPANQPYDVAADLTSRTNLVNRVQPDLYLCIHTNALGVAGGAQFRARGTETYVQQANSASLAAGLAVHSAVINRLGLKDRGIRTRDADDGQIYALGNDPDSDTDYYHVLRESRAPAVLIEVEFHDHPDAEQLLLTPEFLVRAGEAMAAGIISWGSVAGLLSQGPFADVPATHWTAPVINRAKNLGLVKGDGKAKLGFGQAITVERAVVLAVQAYDAALAAVELRLSENSQRKD